MRPLAFLVGLLFTAGSGCGSGQAAPIDASPEHILPSDLGNACGPAAGCFFATDAPGGTCQERCVSLGTHGAICTTRCNGDPDCGPAAQFCNFGEGSTFGVCMAFREDQNDIGCGLVDAAATDASMAVGP